MKLNKEYILRQIAGMWALLPTGQTARTFNGFIKINAVGAFVWQGLEKGKTAEDLIQHLADTYGITTERASADVGTFIEQLRANGCIKD